MMDKLSNGHYFDAWFISDLCTAIEGVVCTTAQDIVEVASEDNTRRVGVYFKKREMRVYLKNDLSDQYTSMHYLALEGISSKYKLEFTEWED